MRKAILAAVCAAFVGGVSAASAQTTAPSNQGMMKSDPMNAQNKMTKKKKMKMKKGTMKSDDGMMKDGMKKDGMTK